MLNRILVALLFLVAPVPALAQSAPNLADNTALAAASTALYPVGVWRNDFAAGNGAPPLFFMPQTGTCAANGMANDGGSCVDSINGASWKARHPSAGIDLMQFGAKCDNTTNDSAALSAWFTYVRSSGRTGLLPNATCKIDDQIYFDLTSVATTGVRIRSHGPTKSILRFTTTASPALRIGGTTDLFYPDMEFGVSCNLAAVCVEFGHPDYSDPINVARVNMWVNNISTGANAVAAQINYYLNSPFTNIIANTGGNGVSLKCRQCQFNNFYGSYSTAWRGIWFEDGYNIANVFHGIDIENIVGGTDGAPVVSTSANSGKNTFNGGTFIWRNNDYYGGGVLISAGQNNFRFIGSQFSRNDEANFNASASLNTLTVNSVASGTIVERANVFGSFIPAGTYIVSQISGTPGGAGNYQLSAAADTGGSSFDMIASRSIYPIATGANAAVVQIDTDIEGTFPMNAVSISPRTQDASVPLNIPAGYNGSVCWRKRDDATNPYRWCLVADGVGGPFKLTRYDSSGAEVDNVLFVDWNTGAVSVPNLAVPVGGKIGAFGAAPATQPSNTGNQNPAVAGSAGAVLYDTGFTGGLGATTYNVGQIVYALKVIGLIAP